MTEMERILKSGVINNDFLKEEVVYEYKITVKEKKVQAIGLDILLKFDEICKKHNLKYFLAFGTLLGAVRHKGFIPWDDDVDVLMPRDDYERLLSLADEFVFPYFLQTPQTDKGYLYSISRVRNTQTCNFTVQRGYWGWNGGIWIDVFPLDRCILNDRGELFEEINMLNTFNSAYMTIPSPYLSDKRKKTLLDNLDLSPMQALRRITELSTKYRNSDTPFVTDYSTTIYNWKKIVWNKMDFASTVDLEFCGYTFPAPVGFDSVLQTTYGDYMKLPPIESRGHWHDGHITDPDKPYIELLKEMQIQRL